MATLPAEGGACGKQDPDPNCNNHFGVTAKPDYPNVTILNKWMPFHVRFAELAQSPGGTATWNPGQITGISFQVADAGIFDVWIDHIAFQR